MLEYFVEDEEANEMDRVCAKLSGGELLDEKEERMVLQANSKRLEKSSAAREELRVFIARIGSKKR